MSTLAQTVAITELATLSNALVGGLGFLLVRAFTSGDNRNRQDNARGTALSLIENRMTTLETRMAGFERKADQTEMRRQTMAEELSTLGAMTDRHEKWHERHDPR